MRLLIPLHTPVTSFLLRQSFLSLPDTSSRLIGLDFGFLVSSAKRQKKPNKSIEETSGCVRPERVKKWPNSLIAT
jgi:hypothetical protein